VRRAHPLLSFPILLVIKANSTQLRCLPINHSYFFCFSVVLAADEREQNSCVRFQVSFRQPSPDSEFQVSTIVDYLVPLVKANTFTMNAFSLFRHAPLLSRRMAAAANCSALRRSVYSDLKLSSFSAQPEKAVCYEDLVKVTLKKMIAERGTDQHTKSIADEDLARRFQHYESVFKEAELCIADLREASGDEREEEYVCANGSVDNAFQAYLDLLDDLRLASEGQLEAYQDARHENANSLKRLRQELAEIMGKGV
jgi:hypothetical protein